MSTLIRSALLVKFSEVAPAVGVDPERLMHHVGADRACMNSPDLQVPETWLAGVLDATERIYQFPSMGLLMAQAWRLSDFGPISLLLQNQPSLRHALGQLERYRHLLSESVAVHIEEAEEAPLVHLKLMADRPSAGRQPIEFSVGTLLCLMKAMLGGKWQPRRVCFLHVAPSSLGLRHPLFGPWVDFGCGLDGIMLDQRDLDRPNPLGDVNLARYAKDFLEQQSLASMPNDGLSAQSFNQVRRAAWETSWIWV